MTWISVVYEHHHSCTAFIPDATSNTTLPLDLTFSTAYNHCLLSPCCCAKISVTFTLQKCTPTLSTCTSSLHSVPLYFLPHLFTLYGSVCDLLSENLALPAFYQLALSQICQYSQVPTLSPCSLLQTSLSIHFTTSWVKQVCFQPN